MAGDERRLIEQLQRIEALFADAASSPGEKVAAANARERLLARLKETQQRDTPIEFKFTLTDRWAKRLLLALLRRYGLEPYRYRGQRHTTVMVRVPKSFVEQTLWPEYEELAKVLDAYLEEVTQRVIAEGVFADSSDAKERPELPGNS